MSGVTMKRIPMTTSAPALAVRTVMNYDLWLPESATRAKLPEARGLPLIVYLHGAGERGLVREHLDRHGFAAYLAGGGYLPEAAVVLVPQCPADCVWDTAVFDVGAIIRFVVGLLDLDRTRVTVTGSSMGGYGTFALAMAFPTLFAGAAPVAGGGMAWRASDLVRTPVRAYHGEADPVVPASLSLQMVDAVRASGGQAEALLLPGLGHNDGIRAAYFDSDLIPWLLACRRTDFSPVPEALSEWF